MLTCTCKRGEKQRRMRVASSQLPDEDQRPVRFFSILFCGPRGAFTHSGSGSHVRDTGHYLHHLTRRSLRRLLALRVSWCLRPGSAILASGPVGDKGGPQLPRHHARPADWQLLELGLGSKPRFSMKPVLCWPSRGS